MLFQSKTKHLSKLSQSEYSAHLLPRNILRQWWLVRAGWCPCQCFKDPVYNFLGGFACPWLVCISYPETPPWMLGCLHRPAPVGLFFENKSHPWEQAFLLDLTRHPPLHAGHSDWPNKTLVSAHGPNDTCCCKTASCSPHHCIITMILNNIDLQKWFQPQLAFSSEYLVQKHEISMCLLQQERFTEHILSALHLCLLHKHTMDYT